MKLHRHNYLVFGLGNCVYETCTETGQHPSCQNRFIGLIINKIQMLGQRVLLGLVAPT
jgi:hypothetical protein